MRNGEQVGRFGINSKFFFDPSGGKRGKPAAGIEPATFSLRGKCSTPELSGRFRREKTVEFSDGLIWSKKIGFIPILDHFESHGIPLPS